MTAVVTMQNGTDTAIQLKKDNVLSPPVARSNAIIAITFCGDAIGDVIPPMLHEKATPSSDITGQDVRQAALWYVGLSSDVPSTAAGTLDMTPEVLMQATIVATRTRLGPVPARESSAAAHRSEMPYFSSTSDMTKPDRKSSMTGSKNAPVATTTACSASIGVPGAGSVALQYDAGTNSVSLSEISRRCRGTQSTRAGTAISGMSSAVRKGAIASVDHNTTTTATSPRQRCAGACPLYSSSPNPSGAAARTPPSTAAATTHTPANPCRGARSDAGEFMSAVAVRAWNQ
mmetsp:Transcript_25891/g.67950  ORF Transcript_25891/g.67950 Transcript_25891/m.67950 type:complete len:288 (-) Transcript_25891:392-1255(-)